MLARNKSIDGLTSLRFFAALHVVFHHHFVFIPGYGESAPVWLRRLVASAPSDVTWFFVLSGFIMTYNYMTSAGELAVPKRQFWAARVARIWPIYLLGLLLYFPIAGARYLSGTGVTFFNASPATVFIWSGVFTLLLCQSWTVVFSSWNNPCWSVSAEASFYSIFPFIAPRIMRMRTRVMLVAMALLWIVSMIPAVYFLAAILGHAPQQTKQFWEVGLGSFPLLRVIPFVIGIATGVIFLRRRAAKAPSMAFLFLSLLSILALCVSIPEEAERLLENAVTPLLAVMTYLLAYEKGVISRILNLRWLVVLGDASYSMYIIHSPLWNYIARFDNVWSILWKRHFPIGIARPGIVTEWNYHMGPITFCLYLGLLIALSLLTRKYVEEPARKFLVRKLKGSERVTTSADGRLPAEAALPAFAGSAQGAESGA